MYVIAQYKLLRAGEGLRERRAGKEARKEVEITPFNPPRTHEFQHPDSKELFNIIKYSVGYLTTFFKQGIGEAREVKQECASLKGAMGKFLDATEDDVNRIEEKVNQAVAGVSIERTRLSNLTTFFRSARNIRFTLKEEEAEVERTESNDEEEEKDESRDA